MAALRYLACVNAIVAGLLIGLPTAATASDVVALGASNTEGKGRGRTPDGVPRSQAYPAQLQQILRGNGCRASVTNAGIAGNTTGQMLRRLPSVVKPSTRVLILQPGGNDARRGEADNAAANIAAIRAFAASRNIQVVMLESLGRLATSYRLPDGQHYSAEGHAAFAAYLAPTVLASAACR
ncbi:MAG: GDSL-type esterase/lipase family protein [Beijerinckiaceae bacterium]|jgi:acyl-CoA thioesterase-1|nr:GDSL-type esterase/lipase family protein [Beijerinckiaceae bacterium]